MPPRHLCLCVPVDHPSGNILIFILFFSKQDSGDKRKCPLISLAPQTSRSGVGRAASCAARVHPGRQRACVLRGDEPLTVAPRFRWLLSCWGLGCSGPSFLRQRQRGGTLLPVLGTGLPAHPPAQGGVSRGSACCCWLLLRRAADGRCWRCSWPLSQMLLLFNFVISPWMLLDLICSSFPGCCPIPWGQRTVGSAARVSGACSG